MKSNTSAKADLGPSNVFGGSSVYGGSRKSRQSVSQSKNVIVKLSTDENHTYKVRRSVDTVIPDTNTVAVEKTMTE